MRTPVSRLILIALAAGMLTTVADIEEARADRRSSLAGNLLILDQDDIYMYPQLTLQHRNLVSFDYAPGVDIGAVLGASAGQSSTPQPQPNDQPTNNFGTNNGGTGFLGGAEENSLVPLGNNAMNGGAVLLFGQEGFAMGIGVHREDQLGATAGQFLGAGDLQLYSNSRRNTWGYFGHGLPVPAATFNDAPTGAPNGAAPGDFLNPLPMIDLLFGFSLGPDNALGARLSIGQNGASVRTLTVGGGDDKTSWNTTVINLVAGYSMTGDFKLDVNLELGLGFYSNTFVTTAQAPDYDDSGGVLPSLSLSGRSIIPLQDKVSLGVLGVLHVNSASFDNEFGSLPNNAVAADVTSFSSSNFFIEAGAGPVYALPDETTVAAYGTVGFGVSSYEGADGDESISSSGILLPGFKLALEHYLWEWLAFRTGLASRFYFGSQNFNYTGNLQNTPNQEVGSTYYEYLWSAGVGVRLGNFELNGTFQTPFVTSGPEFIGGASPGLFSLLNASYKF
jgi:hypothetical protein